MNRNFVLTFRWSLGIAAIAAFVSVMSGCQVDVSGGLGAKALYPDRVGSKSYLGDPRRAMYEGTGGYVEGHTAGSQSDIQGFRKMGGGE